jgi:transposase
MITGFRITQDKWNQTPQTVRIAAASLQHQLYTLNARLTVYQKQNVELRAKVESCAKIEHEQADEIKCLKLKVFELKERLRQNSANSSLPPSSDSPFQPPHRRRSPSERKRGAQTGHQGVGRQLLPIAEVDQVIDLRPDRCSACGSLLLGEDFRPARRQTIELVDGQAFVTEYRNHCLRCLACQKLTRGKWSEDTAAGTFGASISAMVVYLTGRLNLSQRDAVEAMRELFNLKIGLGSVCALQRRVSEHLAEPVAQALEFVQQQASQCVDETGWQENSQLNWLWVNCTAQVTVFQIQSGRGQTDAQTIIGKEETGVVTTDRYPGYSFLQGWRRQICWAHLKRDFTAMAERGDNESKNIGEKLLAETKNVFELFAKARDGTLQHHCLRRRIEPVKARVKELLEAGGAAANAKTAGVCRRILKLNRSLWTFVRVAEVEPTNNRAERALRRAVLWRRKSFGTQSAPGSRFVERILTVVTTLGQQRRSVLAYLKTACATRTAEQNFVGLYLQAT